MQRKSGVVLSPQDNRDWRLNRVMDMPSGAEPYPSQFECWIPSERRDQGSTYACTAYAMATILECIYHKLTGKETPFSTGYLYGNRRETEWKERGEIMRDVTKKTHKYGDVDRDRWECTGDVPEAIEIFEAAYPNINHLAKKLVKGYVRLYDKSEAKAFMARYGIPLFVNLPMDKISPFYDDGLHAVACYKYNIFGFSCINSWGNEIPFITDKKFDDFMEVWGMVPNEEIKYNDVPEEHWAKSAIENVSKRGEMCGFPDGLFHPDEPITRAQMAVILDRLKGGE